MAGAAQAAAMPAWSELEAERKRQANTWMDEQKKAHGVGTRGETVDQAVERAKALLAAAIGPDWEAFAPTCNKASMMFTHKDINGGSKISGLLNVARQVAAAQVKARLHALSTEAPHPPAPNQLAAQKDSIRALEQVEQLLSEDGALAEYARAYGAVVALPAPADQAPAGPAEAGPADAAAVEVDAHAEPLLEEIERTRKEVSEQVCSAVLVGSTGVGKSTMLNGMLMLTEVDEITYASPAFHDTAPRITVPTLKYPTPMEYRLEGIQLIKDLLTDEGVSEDGMDAALAQRLSVLLVKAKEHTEAANIRNRATVEREVYNKVENYAAINELGHLADVPFLHPVGNKTGATTRLSTTDRFGTRYHVFAHTYTEQELLHKLLVGVLAERAARKGAPPDDASGAARKDNYCRWNACVVDELKLGNGGFDAVADEYELHVQFGLPVPELFEREAEPTERDIKLKPFIKRLLGLFEVFAGHGRYLHVDREYVRTMLKDITGTTNPQSYVYKHVYEFNPSRLLQGGKGFVDAPGTADDTPLHRGHLKAACETADHVIAVAEKNLGVGSDTLKVLAEFGVLNRFLNGECKLTVLHNLEKNNGLRGVAAFCNGRPERADQLLTENGNRKTTFTALMGELQKEPAYRNALRIAGGPPATPQQVQQAFAALKLRVESEVRIQAVYPLTFASLTLKPDAAASQLHEADKVEDVLRNTYGAKLLGLMEGLNLERVTDPVSRLVHGPLEDTLEAVRKRLTQAEAYTGGEALYSLMESLRRSRRDVQSAAARSLRKTMSQQFDPTEYGEDAPRGLLAAGVKRALAAFETVLNPHFRNTDAVARTAWLAMRDRFCAPASAASHAREAAQARALEAHTAPTNGEASPHGMNLEDRLFGMFTVPQAALDALLEGVNNAVDECCDACAERTHEMLLYETEPLPLPEQQRAANLLDEYRSLEGASTLRGKVPQHAKFSARTLTVELNKLKKSVLLKVICKKKPTPTASDPAGVATLVDAHLDELMNTLREEFCARVGKLLEDAEQDVCKALQPVQKRSRGTHPRGMETYYAGASGHIMDRCNPERHVSVATQLSALAQRGDEASARARQVVANLRDACADPDALDRAAATYLRMLILQRTLYRQFADGGFVSTARWEERNLPLSSPAAGMSLLHRHYEVTGNATGMDALRATLLALPPASTGPLQPLPEPPGVDDPRDSLWRALSHQLFTPHSTDPLPPGFVAQPAPTVNEHNPKLLKALVLAHLLKEHSFRSVAARFSQDHGGQTIQAYVEEQQAGKRGAGLFELQAAAQLYGCQITLWVARHADRPLLTTSLTPLGERAYNLVLEHTEPSEAGPLHRFLSTTQLAPQPPVMATPVAARTRGGAPGTGGGGGASGSGAGTSGKAKQSRSGGGASGGDPKRVRTL